MSEYKIEEPSAVCEAEILPSFVLRLPEWPSRWARFWHWVFFGIRWERIDG